MKTFRMIGMALFAVLMCVNLASCSSDDDDEVTEEVQVPEDFTILGTWEMIGGEHAHLYDWCVAFYEDGTGYEIVKEDGYTDEGTFTYRYDSKKLILYVQYPGEAILEWKIVDIDEKGKEVTLQYTYIDGEDGMKHTIEYVFRKL